MDPLMKTSHLAKTQRHVQRSLTTINPFTAPACKTSGLKDSGHAPANSIISAPITHLLSVLYVVTKVLSHAIANEETKRRKDFQFGTFRFTVVIK